MYYIFASLKFWCKLPENGVNDTESCRSNIRQCFYMLNMRFVGYMNE